jgi:hypothetical protein
MNANQKGCFAEYKFATIAIENGFNVSMPLLDSSPYDCILEKDGGVFKIQIKYISEHRRLLLKPSNASHYRHEDVDYFAVWHEKLDGFFVLKNIGQRTYSLNLSGEYKENFNNFDIIL